MIKLEYDIDVIQKKLNVSDDKINKEYIVKNFHKIFDLALKKDKLVKTVFPSLKLVFAENPIKEEIPIECLEIYTSLLTTGYSFGNINKIKYDKDKKCIIVNYLITEWGNQIEFLKNLAITEIK